MFHKKVGTCLLNSGRLMFIEIQKKTGLSPQLVRSALGILIVQNLVSFYTEDELMRTFKTPEEIKEMKQIKYLINYFN